MSFNAKVFSDGELPIVQAAIYTVQFGLVASYVKQIFLFNKNAATQTIDLWINASGTARRWRRVVLAQNRSADMLKNGESLQLESGSTIEAVTTTAAAVDYIVSGVEETP